MPLLVLLMLRNSIALFTFCSLFNFFFMLMWSLESPNSPLFFFQIQHNWSTATRSGQWPWLTAPYQLPLFLSLIYLRCLLLHFYVLSIVISSGTPLPTSFYGSFANMFGVLLGIHDLNKLHCFHMCFVDMSTGDMLRHCPNFFYCYC